MAAGGAMERKMFSVLGIYYQVYVFLDATECIGRAIKPWLGWAQHFRQ
jgi:hypothetical protein